MQDKTHFFDTGASFQEPNDRIDRYPACLFNGVPKSACTDGWERDCFYPVLNGDPEAVFICFCKQLRFFIISAMPYRADRMYHFFCFQITACSNDRFSHWQSIRIASLP